jgi:tetratricopeptide (TPR) repeat protein
MTSITVVGEKGEKYEFPLRDLEPRPQHLSQIVEMNDSGGFIPSDRHSAKRLLEALLVLKTAALSLPSPAEEEVLFQEAARNYRASALKPQLPEAVHRLRVQAEGAINDKDFNGAAEFYAQALGIAPRWPEGHFNRALTLAETGDLPTAMVEMKRYLALVPDAPDARAAQDKIYDWERKAGTPH